MFRLPVLALAAVLLLAARPAAALELVMFDAPGCTYCAQWEAEIGEVYARTAEGRRAPLRKVGLRAPRPDDLAGIRGVTFTPTFVLVDEGREVGRIVGYVAEDFFWPMLNELLDKHAAGTAAAIP